MVLQIESGRRNPGKQRDRPSNRRYSRWNSWSPCPFSCKQSCHSDCTQMRFKSCIRPLLCQSSILKDERTCGRCSSMGEGSATSSIRGISSPTPTFLTNYGLRAQANNGQTFVELSTHCLPDYHFSNWGNWSECFSVCRKVRFRQCTTTLCAERVPHMEDGAVKQEEWCVSTKKPESGSEANCEELLGTFQNEKSRQMLTLRQCEITRRKMISQRAQQISRKRKGTPLHNYIIVKFPF